MQHIFSIGEDGFGTRKMTCFCKLFKRNSMSFKRYQDTERKSHSLKVHSYTSDAEYKDEQSCMSG